MAVTGAWAQSGENFFQYCYDCQRSPAYPKVLSSATLSGFTYPYVSYNNDPGNQSDTTVGPWKLECMGNWSSTDNYGIGDGDIDYVKSTYGCTDVPIFRLYQWNPTANEYQHAAYGVVCAYANVNNAVDHTVLFVADGHWGCILTNKEHSSSMNVTFDEDLSTGLNTLVTAATPSDPVTYTVSLKGGTTDATNWTISPTEAAASTQVTATYSGTKHVKSVKAVKKAPAGTPLDNTTTAWTAGTYAVPAGGLTYGNAITVSGDVTLVLTDGEMLTLNKGISLAEGATLTIQGNGTMNVNGTNNSTASTVAGTGMLVLTSGTLNAKGGNGESVYDADYFNGGSGGTAINGSVTVSGGTLTATGGNGGNVNLNDSYGSSYGGSGGTAITGSVTINSGTLAATGGDGGSLNCGMDCHNCKAGNGGDAIGGSVIENGGTTTFANGSDGSYSTGPDCSDLNAGSGGKSHN